MKKLSLKKIIPHVTAVIIFLVLTLSYLNPMLEGKKLRQHDSMQFRGMSKEIVDYREETGKEALWTNSMFGGMPAYLISVYYKSNLFRYLDKYVSLGLKTPASFVFLAFLGFYFLLVIGFRMDPWLGIAGAIAFGLSTYFFIIAAAGHNTKAHALAYAAPVIAGVVMVFRGQKLWGSVVTAIALSIQISANHPQITYYTMLLILVFGVVFLTDAIREKTIVEFSTKVSLLLLAVIVSIGVNITSLYLTYDYGKDSIRGKTELSSEKENRTGGLDKDYILNDYSYGIDETLNLMIPNFKGGATGGLDLKSKTYKELRRNNVPNAARIVKYSPLAYWGKQRFVSGPVYIGAVVVFLFFFAAFFVKGPYKWWLVSATILSIMLAWGKNLMFFSDFFIDYFPGYNKFRAVSMTLVIAQITIPLLALLALDRIIKGDYSRNDFLKALKYSFAISGGISLFFALFPGLLFNFSAPVDEQLIASGWPQKLLQAVLQDRKELLQEDSFRSFIFISLSAIVLYSYFRGWLQGKYFIAVLGILFIADLWPVDRRYLNKDNFETPREQKNTFVPAPANLAILKDNDPDFRVLNLTVSTFNDAVTSYHHKSVGGYHGAKMRRYQELITHYISQNNMGVLNMLNTKYFIVPGPDNQAQARLNPDAYGNAWFIDSFHVVENADEEIKMLGEINTRTEAVVDKRFDDIIKNFVAEKDTTAVISLKSYAPNYLVYEYKSASEQFAVFSEIFYDKGWTAYIDGAESPHFRTDYVLRGMILPAGEHKIEFKFHPAAYYTGEKVSLASSLFLLLLLGILSFRSIKQAVKND